MSKLDTLQEAITAQLGGRVKKLDRAVGELTLTVAAADYIEAALLLRDHPDLKFEQLADKWAGSFDMAIGIAGTQGGAVETFSPVWTNDDYQRALKENLIVSKSIQTDGKAGVFNVVVQDKASGAAGSIKVPFK